MPKLVFIKLEGDIAVEFDKQRRELEDRARQEEPGAMFPPEMFVSYMLDVRRLMEAGQKVENVTEIEDDDSVS